MSAIKAGEAFMELYVEKTEFFGALESAQDRVRTWVKNVGLTMTAAGGTITAGFISALSAGSRQAESMNAFSQVFKGANQEAERLASTLGNRVGRSMESVAAAMTPIGGMVKGLGLSADKAAEFGAAATQAALDISSFWNTSTEEAFRRVRSALSGSSEAVDQFGINLRAQALSLKLVELGYDGNIQKATELQKTLARLAIIQESNANTNAAGDLERTKDQYANITRTLGDSFEKLRATVGNAVKPIAETFLRGLNAVTQAADGLLSKMPGVVRAVAGLGIAATVGGATLATLASKTLHTAASFTIAAAGAVKLIGYLNSIGAAGYAASAGMAAFNLVSKTTLPILAKIPTFGLAAKVAMLATGAATGTLVAAFGAVLAAGAGLAAILYKVHSQTGALQPLFDALGKAGDRFAAVWAEHVSPALEKISVTLGDSFGGVITSIAPLVEMLAELLGTTLVYAAEVAAGVIAALADKVAFLFGAVNRFFGLDDKAITPQLLKEQRQAAPEAAAPEADPEIQRFAEQVKEQIKTPQQRYEETLRKIFAAGEAGQLNAEQGRQAIDKAKQELNDAIQREFDDSAEGQRLSELESFVDSVRSEIETPQEAFDEYMTSLEEAFQRGLIDAEEFRRAAESQQSALDEIAAREQQQRDEEQARQRKEQETSLGKSLNNRVDLARAGGSVLDELKALSRASAEARKQGFGELANEFKREEINTLFSAAKDLEDKAAANLDQADLTTSSRMEAAFGLGQNTIDEQLLEEQRIVSAAARRTADRLDELIEIFDE